MGRVAGSTNPLALGFYTVPEAARLIEGGNAQRIRGWLRGFPRRGTGPLIVRQYEPIEGIQEIGFLDLMELRLIETLREHDVQPRTIRKAIAEARDVFKSEKPFATDKIVLVTDGRHIFVEEVLKKAAREEKDVRLWNLVTKQYEHYELIERSLLKGVTFDPKTHFARTWKPRPERFPQVIIDPQIAYGKPITPRHIPAEIVYEVWKAENENVAAVADWFDMPIQEAEMAVNFQRELTEPEALAA